MQTPKTQRGITIIALIITIIVLLILTVVSIRAIQENGIIGYASRSAFMSKVKKYEEELNLYINNKKIENLNNFDKSTLFANDISTPSIKEIIKSISKNDETKFVIRNGKLEYIGEENQEIEWSKDLGIESKNRLRIYGNSVQEGTPTPDVPIEIESVGDKTKNLWEIDIKEFTVDTKGKRYTLDKPITKPCTFYYRETDYTANGNTWLMGFRYKNGNYVYVYPNHIKQHRIISIDATEDNPVIVIEIRNGGANYISGGKVDNFMLVDGTYTADTMPNYEPYGYKIPITVSNGTETKTTNIYLDEPLRKIEDYADYIDFKNKKIVRKISSVIILKSTTYIASKKKDVCWFSVYSLGSSPPPHVIDTPVISKMFKSLQNVWWQNDEGVLSHKINTTGIYFSLKWERIGLVYDGTNVYKKDDTEKTKPLTNVEIYNLIGDYFPNTFTEDERTIHYALLTPIEQSIELPNIPTIKGTNIIEVNTKIQPSNIELRHKGLE